MKKKIEISSNLSDGVEKFGTVEWSIKFPAGAGDPFDPDQTRVEVDITTPDGEIIPVRAFYYQHFDRNTTGGRKLIEPSGEAYWKALFTPSEPGEYQAFIRVISDGREIGSERSVFKVTDSGDKGFVRSGEGPYLLFDSGEVYFGIGENLAWTHNTRVEEYESYFKKLSQAGCDLVRIWMASWSLALEHNENSKQRHGPGRYDLENAWKLDRIMQSAREHGIYVILVFGSYSELMEHSGSWGEQEWQRNPYNSANGGPCSSPEEFWTDETARNFYKKRLGYITSRWGAHTNLLAFELWNEANAPVFWIKEMTEFLKKVDPYDHLVTTSLGNLYFEGFEEDKIWFLPTIDFIQIHLYGYKEAPIDIADAFRYKAEYYMSKFKKPLLIGEYGLDSGKSDRFYDKPGDGAHIHNALWASLFAQCLGGALNWWWDEYIDDNDMYGVFTGFSRFVKSLDLPLEGWDRAEAEVKTPEAGRAQDAGDVVIFPIDAWGAKDGARIEIKNDGTLKGGRLNRYIHGMEKEDIRVEPVLVVDYPQPGKLILKVEEVSTRAVLNVYIDGEKVFTRAFPEDPSSEQGRWKDRKYFPEWGIYQYTYNEEITIGVPEGRHQINLENVGTDWMSIAEIKLSEYRTLISGRLRVLGLSKDGEAIYWIQDKKAMWPDVYKGIEPVEVHDALMTLSNLRNIKYNMEWWDTRKGIPLSSEEILPVDGKIQVNIPPFYRDIALKVTQVKEAR